MARRPANPIITTGPVSVEGVYGWPMADLAYDPCGADADYDGWLPWAIIRCGPDWYVGLYSCDRGHVWTCGYGLIAHPDDPELRRLKLSPRRLVPSDDYLRGHGGCDLPIPIRVELIDWSPVRNLP